MLPEKRRDDVNKRGAGFVFHKGNINTHKLFTEDRSGLRPIVVKERGELRHNGALPALVVVHC